MPECSWISLASRNWNWEVKGPTSVSCHQRYTDTEPQQLQDITSVQMLFSATALWNILVPQVINYEKFQSLKLINEHFCKFNWRNCKLLLPRGWPVFLFLFILDLVQTQTAAAALIRSSTVSWRSSKPCVMLDAFLFCRLGYGDVVKVQMQISRCLTIWFWILGLWSNSETTFQFKGPRGSV